MTKNRSVGIIEFQRDCVIRASKDASISVAEVAKILGLSEVTVHRWIKSYNEHGEITFNPTLGRQSKFTEEIVSFVENTIDTSEPSNFSIKSNWWTARAVKELIFNKFEVDVSLTQIRGHFVLKKNKART